MDIAVIGSSEFTLGFRLVGVRTTVDATEPAELEDAVSRIVHRDDVGILVMDQGDYDQLSEDTQEDLRQRIQPTLVAIGLTEDSALREQIKQAVGVDLWKQE